MKFLRLHDVETKVGLKKTEIYRRIKCDHFPRPICLGARASVWVESQVDAWMSQKVAEQEPSVSGQPGSQALSDGVVCAPSRTGMGVDLLTAQARAVARVAAQDGR